LSEAASNQALSCGGMPLEGHYKRTNTPLRRLTKRERNVVLSGLAVTVVALVALLLATAGDSQPAPGPGCIRVVVAGRVGGELVHACGAEAKATCARSATFDNERSHTVVTACREAGIKF
jgi:hypothetical protein